MKLGIVGGMGRWGQNIVKTLQHIDPTIELVYVAHKREVPAPARSFRTLHDLINFGDVSAVVIASPAEHHARQLYRCVLARLPVFIEKPFCLSLEDSWELSKAWEKCGNPLLLVNHVHLFNPGLLKLKELLKEQEQKASYIEANLHNDGPVRADCSALWDYGSHAVAVALFMSGFPWPRGRTHVRDASAVSHKAANGYVENVEAELLFADEAKGVIHVGNGMAYKGAEFRVEPSSGQSHKNPSSALDYELVFNDVHKQLYRSNACDDCLPFDQMPPLELSLRTFLRALRGEHDVASDIRFGMRLPLEVVRVLDAIDECLEDLGNDRMQRVMTTTLV